MKKLIKYKQILMKNRTTIINDLIKKDNLKRYLEIGVQQSVNGSKIECEFKFGVDIVKPSNANKYYNKFYIGKSDEFFKNNIELFDIIFIDGDHSINGVYNDFINSLNLNAKYIVLHDATPLEEESTKWPNKTKYGTYNGEVYKILTYLIHFDIDFTLHKEDHGVLIIEPELIKEHKFDYAYICNIKYEDYLKALLDYEFNMMIDKVEFDYDSIVEEETKVEEPIIDEIKPKRKYKKKK